jgi:hypothetical protein
MKSLDEFKAGGGVLHGEKQGMSSESYDGCPRPYNEKLGTTFDKLGLHSHSGSNHQARDSGVDMGHDGMNPGHSGNVLSGSGAKH